jgi:hypothetical protein
MPLDEKRSEAPNFLLKGNRLAFRYSQCGDIPSLAAAVLISNSVSLSLEATTDDKTQLTMRRCIAAFTNAHCAESAKAISGARVSAMSGFSAMALSERSFTVGDYLGAPDTSK